MWLPFISEPPAVTGRPHNTGTKLSHCASTRSPLGLAHWFLLHEKAQNLFSEHVLVEVLVMWQSIGPRQTEA